ncbi:transcription termination/antitermination NusG family protein, partial [Blautia sp. Sow4_E7]|uniref:transcription termination/antitermination NusG family protein n=1 Tax=Blautia sp. Sow4_E7 TaxID=3438749 RepID=UPI003F91FC2F
CGVFREKCETHFLHFSHHYLIFWRRKEVDWLFTIYEENIRCQCQRLISSDILKRCFIPYYQQKKRFQGKWHIQERILFPGYVFLIAENLEQPAENLRKVTGMTRLLGTG